ncbi:MAG: helix-turn-helix transcriptional regulator [Lachnospiraceae bacterium]|nr:helix-turn-helix transcriptional regulator [Lachnospiraceae bacterium]
MELQYICNHILRTTHIQIRQYRLETGNPMVHRWGDSLSEDVLEADKDFADKLIAAGKKDYPVIYMEIYPIYYAVIYSDDHCFILGPINVEKQKSFQDGKSIDIHIAKSHNVREIRIPRCSYEIFCEEVLLLFHLLSGKELTYQQLNEKNYMTDELQASMKQKESKILFSYQEYAKSHNPYDREMREMESIRKGDVDRLKRSIDEVFSGEYAVLSKNSLQSSKNLAIVGLAISARAAIEGGIPYEDAFSMNDSYIIKVDESRNVGEIEALVRQAKIRYAEMIYSLAHNSKKNEIIEECKNLIFQRMHSKIVIRELADDLNVSLEYLSKLFRKTEGIRLSDYIMKQKVRIAENLLIYSEYSIEQIALYLGFSSQSHFGEVFRKHENVTPMRYRNKYAKKDFFEN